jgi:bifunctional DNase/RNase
MALVEMVIDSLRQAIQTNEWVVILKERAAECYLPIYIDLCYADVLKKALCEQQCSEPEIVDPSSRDVSRILATAESVNLVIDRFQDGLFHAKLLATRRGEVYPLDYSLGKALVLGVKAGARIFAEETVLASAGIGAQA